MVSLLSTRAAIDMHHEWVISETEVNHCQNEIDTSEDIREIKAQYAMVIGDAEAAYRSTMMKAVAVHLASTSEAEVI